MSPIEFVRTRYALALGYVRADSVAFALAVIATAAPQILADALLDERDALRIAALLGLVQLYVNLLITFRTLNHADGAPPGYQRRDLTEARFLSAFMMALLSDLAILIGLVLLVVPGVLLFLLWSLALPALAAERLRGVESLGVSWRLVRPALGRLTLTALPLVAALVVAVLFVVAVAMIAPDADLFVSIVINVAASAVFPFMASVWTFAYLALRDTPTAA